MYGIDESLFPPVKKYRFNPADYNVTYRIVAKIHDSKVSHMSDGFVIVDYRTADDLMFLFFRLAIYIKKPEDVEVPPTPAELRRRNYFANVQLFIRFLQIGGVLAPFIYTWLHR